VWAVRDRVLGTRCALKVLAKDAGELELVALVREAVALSGLEGLGVPRVLAFGSLEDKRRYMVRELVEGRSLDEIFDQSNLARRSEAEVRGSDWRLASRAKPIADEAILLSVVARLAGEERLSDDARDRGFSAGFERALGVLNHEATIG